MFVDDVISMLEDFGSEFSSAIINMGFLILVGLAALVLVIITTLIRFGGPNGVIAHSADIQLYGSLFVGGAIVLTQVIIWFGELVRAL